MARMKKIVAIVILNLIYVAGKTKALAFTIGLE
jgi:hypothetical protein